MGPAQRQAAVVSSPVPPHYPAWLLGNASTLIECDGGKQAEVGKKNYIAGSPPKNNFSFVSISRINRDEGKRAVRKR